MRRRGSHIAVTALLLVMAAFCLLPFVWVVCSAFKTNTEIFTRPFGLPARLDFSNFETAWNKANIGAYFLNSAFVSVTSVAILLIVGSMASYVIARVWKSSALYTFFALGIMIPLQAIVIPIFVIIKGIGLHNTRLGLIVAYIISGLSFAIFVLTAFFRTLPSELEEAATIDGCSRTGTFFRIMMPLSKPGLATVGTFMFFQFWNEYLFASVLIMKPALKTLTQGIMSLKGQYSINYGVLCAGLTFVMVPVIAAFVALQKQVISGLMAGAIKE